MNGEIICVGTELLLGNIVNTNAQYLGQGLAELGINMYNQSVVGDNPARLKSAIREAMERSDVIILTGGLGPTADDITKETVASLLGVELILNPQILQNLEEYYARQGRVVPRGVEKQALIPEGAVIFGNDVGTAPGFAIEKSGCRIITIPGPPKEMKTMFDGYVKPYLKGASGRSILSNDLHIYGLGESEVANILGELLDGSNPTAATYAKIGEVTVRVTASGETEEKAILKKEELTRKIADKLGSNLYLVGEGELSFAAVEELRSKGLKVATAESCTAGMLSKSLTDISGSSAVFEMGVSAYANDIKCKVLGVPQEVIETYGAVSVETAAMMAEGVRNVSGANIGIGITGVAGPEPSEGKPVGLVYVGMTDGKSVWIRELNAAFACDREKVRTYATLAALDLIRRYAVAYPEALGGGAATGESIIILRNAADFTLPVGAAVMGLKSRDEIEKLKAAVEVEEPREVTPVVALHPEELESMEGMEMIGFVPDPDAHIGYEDIATDTEGFITDGDEEDMELELQLDVETAEKPPLIKRILKYLLPWKGDPVNEIIRKMIFLIALIVFVATGIYLIGYLRQGDVNSRLVEEAREIYQKAEEGTDDNGISLSFKTLYEQNPDVVGWINIAGTKVDYPVYQTDDNDFYVTHDMSREESRYGAIFADSNAQITPDGNSQNLVLYGHNMIDDSMFGSLLEYNNLSYYKENPVIDFDTLYGEGAYKIFAVIITNAYKEQDDGFVFNYRQNTFSSDNNFLNWIENVKVRSLINTDVDVVAGDEILTLSTCSYEFEEARTVVFARKIRQGESRYTNTKVAKKNKTPLMPQAYYDKNGGKKPEIDIEYQSTIGLQSTTSRIEAFTAEGEKVEIKEEDIDADNKENLTFIEMEDLEGLSLEEAIAKINEAGLHISSVEYTGTDGDNIIMKQSIKKGSDVAVGSGITLTVSGSEVEITVPDFVGLSTEKAEELANEAGLTLSYIMCSSVEKKDTVIMQAVEPNTVTTDRYLALYVSNGRNRVPSVEGFTEKEAKSSLKASGFKVKVTKVKTLNAAQIGRVTRQSVAADEYYDMGETITIYVGKKSDETESEIAEETTSEEESFEDFEDDPMQGYMPEDGEEYEEPHYEEDGIVIDEEEIEEEDSSKTSSKDKDSSKDSTSSKKNTSSKKDKTDSSKTTSSKVTSSKTSSKASSSKATSSKESTSSKETSSVKATSSKATSSVKSEEPTSSEPETEESSAPPEEETESVAESEEAPDSETESDTETTSSEEVSGEPTDTVAED